MLKKDLGVLFRSPQVTHSCTVTYSYVSLVQSSSENVNVIDYSRTGILRHGHIGHIVRQRSFITCPQSHIFFLALAGYVNCKYI